MNAAVLLAEDEPVSRAFLIEALATFGLRCDAVADGLEALEQASRVRYDALLLDLNLPGCDGIAIVQSLCADAHAASHATPALALTADDTAATRHRLLDAGFSDVACKPIAMQALEAALQRLGLATSRPRPLAADSGSTLPDSPWDDAQALSAAGGNRGIVDALRGMMLDELSRQRDLIDSALQRGDASAARHELHRLRASCGFCGATALALSVDALYAALAHAGDADASEFFADVDRLLRA